MLGCVASQDQAQCLPTSAYRLTGPCSFRNDGEDPRCIRRSSPIVLDQLQKAHALLLPVTYYLSSVLRLDRNAGDVLPVR